MGTFSDPWVSCTNTTWCVAGMNVWYTSDKLYGHTLRTVTWGSRLLGQKIPIALTPALSQPESWKCRPGMSVTAATVSVNPNSPLFHFKGLVQKDERCTFMKLIFENIFLKRCYSVLESMPRVQHLLNLLELVIGIKKALILLD